MVEQSGPKWFATGVSLQCQANRYCAMEGPSSAVPVVSIGRPDRRLTVGCEVCGIFACGGCAKREALRLRLGRIDLFAGRLACPLCGSVLGDLRSRRAVLHSAHFGPLAELDTAVTPWCLNDDSADALKVIDQAVAYHNDKALRLLYIFNTQVSVAGSIKLAEMTTEDSPSESVAWLYRALLCAKAGYPIAARHALNQLQTLDKGHGDTTAATEPGSVVSQLRLTLDNGQLIDKQLEDLSKRLVTYDKQFVKRIDKVFNTELAQYHGVVRSYWSAEIKLSDAINKFFTNEADLTPAVKTFVAAFKLERNLDFSQVNSERESFIKLLCEVLDSNETTELLGKTMAFRIGSVSQTAYYLHLLHLAEEKQISLAPFPALASYFQYIALSSSIEPEAVNGDLWDCVQAGYKKRIRTSTEYSLVEEANRVYLTRRLLNYCQGRLGVARIQGTYAPQPSAFRGLTKNLEADKPQQSLSQRFRHLWRRLLSKDPPT